MLQMQNKREDRSPSNTPMIRQHIPHPEYKYLEDIIQGNICSVFYCKEEKIEFNIIPSVPISM